MPEIKRTATFSSKPSPVFPSYRPMLRVGQNLLVLKLNSYGSKASLLKLHLFSWGFKELKNLEAIQSFVMSNSQERIRFFGIEPTLNRALSLNNRELFKTEKPFLSSIGKNPTESSLLQLQKFWKNA